MAGHQILAEVVMGNVRVVQSETLASVPSEEFVGDIGSTSHSEIL